MSAPWPDRVECPACGRRVPDDLSAHADDHTAECPGCGAVFWVHAEVHVETYVGGDGDE